MIVIGKEILCVLYHDPPEQDQREQVGNGHQTVADVRRVPEELDADERAESADDHMQHPVNLHFMCAEQEGKGGFPVGIPAQYRREAEQDQGNDDYNLPKPAQILTESCGGQHRAVGNAAVPHAADHDDKRGKGADDEGIEKDLDDAVERLLDGNVHLGRGVNHGRGTGARFVGEHTALHTAPDCNTHGRTGHAADHCIAGKSGLNNEPQRLRNQRDIHDKNHESKAQIDQRHDRCEIGGDIRDFLYAAEDDQPVNNQNQDRDDPGDHRAAACKAADSAADGVYLQSAAGDKGDENSEDGKGSAQDLCNGFLLHALCQNVHDTAAEVAFLILYTKVHGQGDLRKFSGHTAQRGDPHPEDRAGPAHGDRIGHADDVAVSHAGGQGGGERFVGADLPDALVGLLLHVPYDFPESGSETGELYSFQPDCKVQPYSEEHRQHDRSEQERAQIT